MEELKIGTLVRDRSRNKLGYLLQIDGDTATLRTCCITWQVQLDQIEEINNG